MSQHLPILVGSPCCIRKLSKECMKCGLKREDADQIRQEMAEEAKKTQEPPANLG